MRIAHLGDLHLGWRQFDRSTPAGLNQREADVAAAWNQAVLSIIAERPDLVLLAGDIFHSVRPTNAAIMALYHGLATLRSSLPDVRIVLVSGDHDTPKTSETTMILDLYRTLGVTVATRSAEAVTVGDCTVIALPYTARLDIPAPGPRSILVTHGEAPGIIPFSMDRALTLLDPAQFAGWLYVALGHYHVAHEVAPNAWYAGSLDYTSSNPWADLIAMREHGYAAKGYLLVETEPFSVRRIELPVVRPHLDLPPLYCTVGMTLEQFNAKLRERLTEYALAGAVVRLVVEQVPPSFVRECDHTMLRQFKSEALHLHVDFRRAKNVLSPALGALDAKKRLAPEALIRQHLADRVLPPDVDRDELTALGLRYYDEAGQ